MRSSCRGSWSPLRRLQIWKISRSLSSTAWWSHGLSIPNVAGIGDHGQCGEFYQRAHRKRPGHASQQGTMCRSLATTRSMASRSWHLDIPDDYFFWSTKNFWFDQKNWMTKKRSLRGKKEKIRNPRKTQKNLKIFQRVPCLSASSHLFR